MSSYVLTWNPKKWTIDDAELLDEFQRCARGETVESQWSCGRCKRIVAGDIIFHLRQGIEPRGIFAIGRATGPVFRGEHWSNKKGTANYVRFNLISVADPRRPPPISRSELNRRPFDQVNWNTQVSGISVPEDVAEALFKLWNRKIGETLPTTADDICLEELLFEGARQVISVNGYERSPVARKRCIEFHGTKCAVCEVSLATIYGKAATNLIHVHHVVPLSETNGEYQLDPIRDLIPICPNCHAIIHSRRPAYKVHEVQTMLRRQRRGR